MDLPARSLPNGGGQLCYHDVVSTSTRIEGRRMSGYSEHERSIRRKGERRKGVGGALETQGHFIHNNK